MPERTMLSADDALETILGSTSRLTAEAVALPEALGRVLAEDVRSPDDLPPFDNSAMDGYAVIASDTAGVSRDNPAKLRVLAEAPAGTMVTQEVITGTAVRIMTGAPMPPGADAVVMVENTESHDGIVRVYHEVERGANVRLSGEDVKRDELVMTAGSRIRPAEMGMLAALGKAQVTVYRKPRIAIITSGDELVDVSAALGPGQIRDSNRYSLMGQVLRVGAEVSVSARVTDEKDELEQVLSSAAAVSDMIIASGGVSVGDYDFVKATLAKLGDIRFWKVRIKPGKPLVYGHIGETPVFGLPGNPVSSMVTFDLFVRPAIQRMMGAAAADAPYTMVSGTLAEDIAHRAGIREFVRTVTRWEGGRYVVTSAGKQGSGRLSSMVNANSYAVLPEEKGDAAAGECLQIILFE